MKNDSSIVNFGHVRVSFACPVSGPLPTALTCGKGGFSRDLFFRPRASLSHSRWKGDTRNRLFRIHLWTPAEAYPSKKFVGFGSRPPASPPMTTTAVSTPVIWPISMPPTVAWPRPRARVMRSMRDCFCDTKAVASAPKWPLLIWRGASTGKTSPATRLTTQAPPNITMLMDLCTSTQQRHALVAIKI